MGQYFVADKPTFVENGIYTPPIDLMEKVGLANDKRVTDYFTNTNLLESAIAQIQHLDLPNEKEIVKELQNKYKPRVDELVKKMNETKNWRALMPELTKLQNEMGIDKATGLWSDVEGRYKAYQNYLKENKDTDPMILNSVTAKKLNELDKELAKNKSASFSGGKLYNMPNLLDEKSLQLFKDIKADIETDFLRDSKGNIITRGGMPVWKTTNKIVRPGEVEEIALGRLLGMPEYKGFMNQMQGIPGFESYYEPFYIEVKGKDGKKHKVLNGKNAFVTGQIMPLMRTYGHSEKKLEETKSGLKALQHQYDVSLEGMKFKNKVALEQLKAQNEIEKLKKEGKIDDADHLQTVIENEKIITKGQANEYINRYSELIQKQQNGKKLTQEEQDFYNDIETTFFNNIPDKKIKALATGLGIDTSKNTNLIKTEILKVLGEVGKAKQDDSYGVTMSPAINMSGSTGFVVPSLEDGKRQEILKKGEVFEKIMGTEFEEYFSENVHRSSPSIVLNNPKDTKQKRIFKILDSHLQTSVGSTLPVGVSDYDYEGEKRNTETIVIEGRGGNAITRHIPMYYPNEKGDIFTELKNITRLNSLEEMVANEWITVSTKSAFKPGTWRINIKPGTKMLQKGYNFVKPNTFFDDKVNGVSLVIDNVTEPIIRYSPDNTREENEIAFSTNKGPIFRMIKTKLDATLFSPTSPLYKKLNEGETLSVALPSLPDKLFNIENNNNKLSVDVWGKNKIWNNGAHVFDLNNKSIKSIHPSTLLALTISEILEKNSRGEYKEYDKYKTMDDVYNDDNLSDDEKENIIFIKTIISNEKTE